MKIAFNLCHIWLSGMFSIHGFFEDLKAGGKKTGKQIAYIFLFLYVIVVFGGMFIFVLNSIYSSLKPLGLQSMTLAITGIAACLITLFFGFISATANYVTNTTEEFLLSMPIKSVDMFAAKFLQTYAIEFILAFAITCIGALVYAKGEGLLANPMLYVAIIIAGLSFPAIPVSITYIVLIIVFNCGKAAVNKRILTVTSTILLIVLILGFNLVYQRAVQNLNNPEVLAQLMNEGGFDVVKKTIGFFPPAKWFINAVASLQISAQPVVSGVLHSLLWTLLLGSVSAGSAVAVIFLLSPLYCRSIIGFNEVRTKKLASGTSNAYIKTGLKSVPIFWTMLKRDMLCVLREPVFFINGPFLVIFMPVIFIISMMMSLPKDVLTSLPDIFNKIFSSSKIVQKDTLSTIQFILAGAGSMISVLIGTMTSLSATAFSREGKGLFNLKAMPISVNTILVVKIIHAMFYAVVGILFCIPAIVIFLNFAKLPFNVFENILTITVFIILSLSLSFLVLLLDLLIDMAHPKLDWENPQAAFKQNLNAVIGVFITMGAAAVFVLLGVFVLPKNIITLIVCAILFVALDIVFWKIFCRYAEKQWCRIE